MPDPILRAAHVALTMLDDLVAVKIDLHPERPFIEAFREALNELKASFAAGANAEDQARDQHEPITPA